MYTSTNSPFLDNNFLQTNITSNIFTSPTAITIYQWLPIIIFAAIFVIPFFGPIFVGSTFYLSSFILWLTACKRVYNKNGVDINSGRNFVCRIFCWMSYLWHGYEIEGSEKLPSDGALIVFFQGTLPLDVVYFSTNMWKYHKRTCYVQTHTKQYLVPGWKRVHKRLNFIPMSREDCVATLMEGNDVVVTLGEDFESKGKDKYQINWNKQTTFATIAQAAKASIIPAFTKNIGEAFWSPWFITNSGRRYPIAVGGLPVKLTTIIGQPIPYNEGMSTKELAFKTVTELQNLVDFHQRRPGNRIYALFDRLEIKEMDELVELDEIEKKPPEEGEETPDSTTIEYSEFV